MPLRRFRLSLTFLLLLFLYLWKSSGLGENLAPMSLTGSQSNYDDGNSRDISTISNLIPPANNTLPPYYSNVQPFVESSSPIFSLKKEESKSAKKREEEPDFEISQLFMSNREGLRLGVDDEYYDDDDDESPIFFIYPHQHRNEEDGERKTYELQLTLNRLRDLRREEEQESENFSGTGFVGFSPTVKRDNCCKARQKTPWWCV